METVKQTVAAAQETASNAVEDFSQNLEKQQAEAERQEEIKKMKEKADGAVEAVAEGIVDAQNAISSVLGKKAEDVKPSDEPESK